LDGFSVRVDCTYTVAKDEITQLDLLRRQRDKLSISATLQAAPALLLSATFIYTGPWLGVYGSVKVAFGPEGFL
jgi:vitamin B12 transporter